MADYVSIDEFNQGWTFYTKTLSPPLEDVNQPGFDWPDYGYFPCSEFSCYGCDDWLDAFNENRKVKNLYNEF